MKIIKILLVFSFVFFSGSVFADTYPSQSGYQGFGVSAPFSSMQSACDYVNNARGTAGTIYVYTVGGYQNLSCRQVSYGGEVPFSLVSTCPSGGTVSGTSCINAPACTSPQVRNSITCVCEAPPVTCTAGDTMNLSIPMGTYPPSGTPPTFKLSQDRTSVSSVLQTVSVGGCVYTIPLNASKTGCFSDQNNVMYCNTVATKNGSYLSGSDTAKIATPSDTPIPSAKLGCITSGGGVEICNTSPTKNCGTVNGTSVCFKDGALQSNGLPAAIINGQVVGTTQNVNGQTERCAGGGYSTGTTCINVPNLACGPGTAFVCLQPEGTTSQPAPNPVPISNDPVTVTKHASVTNPDNSRTVTDTTTVDIVGSSPYKQTQQINAAGEIVSTTYTGAILGANGTVSTAPGDGSDTVDTASLGAAFPVGDLTGIDGVFSAGTTAMSTATGGISASNFLSSAPVPQSAGNACQTVPMNYKSLHYTFDPCGKLAMFREMFAYLLYILTVYSIYEIAVRPSVNA